MYDEKRALRHAMLKERNSFSWQILGKTSVMIQDRVKNIDEFTQAKTLGAYHPFGSEVNTLQILSSALQLKKQVTLPRVEGENIIFAEVKDLGNDLEVGHYGIMEPKHHCPIIDKMDLVLVPGIAWDRHGRRLGYGKGYYDRYISSIKTKTVGLAYDFQILENIPYDDNDFSVDLIVTETQTITT